MPFERFLCWRSESAVYAMRTNAETIPDDIFLAVHNPTHYQVRRVEGTAAAKMEEQEFLEAFLRQGPEHVQAAVVGESGTGKSHFIHWIKVNIPDIPDRVTITIPKAGTSLRGILLRLIEQLPLEGRGPYLERLNATRGEGSSLEEAKVVLLDRLAQVVEMGGTSSSRGEERSFLCKNVPNLFRDPHLRKHFLRDGGVVEDLARYIFSERDKYQPRDERCLFKVDDFRFGGLDVRKTAEETRAVIPFLRLDAGDAKVASLVNEHLDVAIASCLNFDRNSLVELMNDLRRYLRKQGKSLVMLIEDFTVLQGIDTALLQALITPPVQEENALCELRWVMAITRGYYERLHETVRTRMNFVVDLDRDLGGEDKDLREWLYSFAARYLNAVRLGKDRIQAHYENLRRGGNEDLPNACESCEHKSDCHTSFEAITGTVGDVGIGLYPLNKTAIHVLVERLHEVATVSTSAGRLNPRRIIDGILLSVLDIHAHTIKEGQFPPSWFGEAFGIRMSPTTQRELESKYPADPKRLVRLQEFWSQGDTTPLPEGLYKAFELPPLSGRPPVTIPIPPVPPIPPVGPTVIDAIRSWGNGEVLKERYLRELRNVVFEAIVEEIDWDAYSLNRTDFSGTGGKPFRVAGISFVNQETRVDTNVPIQLVIPKEEGDLLAVASVFERLFQYRETHGWDFPKGEIALAEWKVLVREWGDSVLEQILTLRNRLADWDLPTASFQLLAVGSVLSPDEFGKPRNSAARLAPAVYCGTLQNENLCSSSLAKLLQRISEMREDLRKVLNSWTTGPKGGQAGDFVDGGFVLGELENLLKSGWKISQVPPGKEECKTTLEEKVSKLYREIKDGLPSAVREEYEKIRKCREMIRETFGDKTTTKDLKSIFEKVDSDTFQFGIRLGNRIGARESIQALGEGMLERFRDYVDMKIGDAETNNLPLLASGQKSDVDALYNAQEFLQRFIAEAEVELSERKSRLAGEAGVIMKSLDNIERSINGTLALLDELGGIR